jgi:hypothetical protein
MTLTVGQLENGDHAGSIMAARSDMENRIVCMRTKAGHYGDAA